MTEMYSKHGTVKIFAKTAENEALEQIAKMANSPIGENAHIRIMPDAHVGAGCTIGTTMIVTDKICPNTVGVDIGCGVSLAYTDIDFSSCLDKLDKTIRENIPFGMAVHSENKLSKEYFERLWCWDNLTEKPKERALKCLGTLGGGNHFIEAYDNGLLAVHSGSRNIGLTVANYYQHLAEERFKQDASKDYKAELATIPPQEREAYIKARTLPKVDKDLTYLAGDDMRNYIYDADVMVEFAERNREAILDTIISFMGGEKRGKINSTHNYIGLDYILRKGAIKAYQGELLIIPLNMRDGALICKGKGNPDWNYSAPHGAGRLYSRTKAKEAFTVEQYTDSMSGIYTTCINNSTLDEAPFAYKDYQEIMQAIEPTVEIIERIIPIYNFKAN